MLSDLNPDAPLVSERTSAPQSEEIFVDVGLVVEHPAHTPVPEGIRADPQDVDVITSA